jgi:hypothetical protein
VRRAGALALALALGAIPASTAPAKGSCKVAVQNKTPFRVLIHIDGAYWGWVNPQESFTFTGVPRGNIVIYGTTQYNEFFWGPKPLKCEVQASWDVVF